MSAAHLGYWTFSACCAVEILKNSPKAYGFVLKDILTGAKVYRNFKHYHEFSFIAFFLDSALQAVRKIPNWKPRSKYCALIVKSRQHAPSISLTLNSATIFFF